MESFSQNVLIECYGLTGGIATGKSTVAQMLKELGCYIIDTDQIARDVVMPNKPAYNEIVAHFGKEVLNDDGTLNREKLRWIIIDDPQKRSLLNAITHPRIGQEVLHLVHQYRSREDGYPIIVDVPLLFEAGWHSFFKAVILVYVPVEVQIQRLMIRDNLTKEEAERTIKFQMSIEEKKARAHYVIDNSGTLEETKKQVHELFAKIFAAK